ncbi:MAG: porin family protein [Bacteroidales bacterium]|nr:porin family protein [Bacteroidales bacterium]
MKKIMTLAVVACMALAANAQGFFSDVTYIARAGVDVATVTGKVGNDKLDSRIGFYVGGEIQKPIITDGMYVGAGLGLKTKGYKYDTTIAGAKYERNENLTALEIPVNLGYNIRLAEDFKFNVHGGLFVDFDLFGKTTETGEADVKLGDYTDKTKGLYDKYSKFGWGLAVGGGIWYKQFNLDVNFQFGMNKPAEQPAPVGKLDNKYNQVAVTLGYAF